MVITGKQMALILRNRKRPIRMPIPSEFYIDKWPREVAEMAEQIRKRMFELTKIDPEYLGK